MTAFDWALVALWTLNLLVQPIAIGKARKARTEKDALIGSVVSLVLVVGLLLSRGVL